KMRRLFLAIPLPEEVQNILSSFVSNNTRQVADLLHHRGFRWLAPQGRHITLLFIGWVNPQSISEVLEILTNSFSGQKPFTILFENFCFMPPR
ncbi:MAG TPA: 2'-5' RNA ligase family protein, partial [Flavobacterium sp.]|nr:2'-5' RNA ligase family protein [Flavobacterium sp.]